MDDENWREKIQERIDVAEKLFEKSTTFADENLTGSMKLSNRIKSELRFLKKIKSGKIEFKDDHLSSSNLTSLEALVTCIEDTKCISAILCPFHVGIQNGDDEEIFDQERKVIVDIVCNDGSTWMKVVARNAKALLTAWEGRGGFGEKSIITQAELLLATANTNLNNFHPPEIHFVFYKGVPLTIANGLQKIGITVKGNIVDDQNFETDNLLNNSKLICPKLESKKHKTTSVNLDITALLCLVSNLCHGKNNFEFAVPVLTKQAIEEQNSPVLSKIEKFIENKTLYACETAIKSFNDIVQTVGGEKEKLRSSELLKKVIVVDDNPSERTMFLQNSGKINERSKVIFGTGDSLKAVTVTANTGFVRAASQCDVRFSVFIHEARALTERKEKSAKCLDSKKNL
uniref:UPF0415 protein C7orf25 homolog n=1 Tax=Styela clava TaxID=7725 RepID=UPI00193AB640|nr:UPF0415 protein C7orf25 homolog [Styela clava]